MCFALLENFTENKIDKKRAKNAFLQTASPSQTTVLSERERERESLKDKKREISNKFLHTLKLSLGRLEQSEQLLPNVNKERML